MLPQINRIFCPKSGKSQEAKDGDQSFIFSNSDFKLVIKKQKTQKV